jgi:hypothetical protein
MCLWENSLAQEITWRFIGKDLCRRAVLTVQNAAKNRSSAESISRIDCTFFVR